MRSFKAKLYKQAEKYRRSGNRITFPKGYQKINNIEKIWYFVNISLLFMQKESRFHDSLYYFITEVLPQREQEHRCFLRGDKLPLSAHQVYKQTR